MSSHSPKTASRNSAQPGMSLDTSGTSPFSETLSPALVLADQHPHLVFGSPGADRQCQRTMLAFVAAAAHWRDRHGATAIPIGQADHFPVSFSPRTPNGGSLELWMPASVGTSVRERGHLLSAAPGNTFGKGSMRGVDLSTRFRRADGGLGDARPTRRVGESR